MMIWNGLCTVLCCSAVLIGCGHAVVGVSSERSELTVMSYNIKGSFGDDARLQQLPANISFVIKEIAGGLPDIVVLQEVEHYATIEELQEQHLALRRYPFMTSSMDNEQYLHYVVLSKLPLEATYFHNQDSYEHDRLRGVLELQFEFGGERLYLFVAHLKSKRGGEAETEPLRTEIFELIMERIQRLAMRGGSVHFVVAGDLNTEIAPPGVDSTLVAYDTELYRADNYYVADILELDAVPNGATNVLVSPWSDTEWPGSYYYQGEWTQIDHFLLSTTLFDDGAVRFDDFAVVHSPFLLNEHNTPDHDFSDHLPLLLTLQIR